MAKSQATAERLRDKRSNPTDRTLNEVLPAHNFAAIQNETPASINKEEAYTKMKDILLKVLVHYIFRSFTYILFLCGFTELTSSPSPPLCKVINDTNELRSQYKNIKARGWN